MKKRRFTQIFLNRCDDIPPDGPHLMIRKIEPGDVPVLVILSPKVEGFRCHWTGANTAACVVGDGLCPWCLKKFPMKWYGFIHVWEQSLNVQTLIMMTAPGANRLKAIQGDRESLRGSIVVCSRQYKTSKSSLVFTDKGQIPSYKVLPMARSAEPTLRRIWKFPDSDCSQGVPGIE
jgi:hypothetical protein